MAYIHGGTYVLFLERSREGGRMMMMTMMMKICTCVMKKTCRNKVIITYIAIKLNKLLVQQAL